MASDFMTYEEAIEHLEMPKDAFDELIKSGKLRAFIDGGQKKFRVKDIQAFKADSRATVVGPAPAAEAEFNATDIEFEGEGSGAAGGDQTSILGAEESSDDSGVGALQTPAKDGSSSGLDLAEIDFDVDSEPMADESDQTSVLPVGDDEEGPVAVTSEEPVFEFSEEEEGSGSVLVADESESSADILQVAEEVEDDSSSDLVNVPAADKSASGAGTTELSEADLVADILDSGDESEISDDALETVDLSDLGDLESSDALATVSSADELLTEMAEGGEEGEGSSAETLLVSDVPEPQGYGEEETIGLDQTEADTQTVGEGVPIGAGAEDGTTAEPFMMGPGMEAPMMPMPMADYPVQPSVAMNVLLGISGVLVLFAGYLALSVFVGAAPNPVTQWVAEMVNKVL